ncbi:C45 family autoproteolytic acyltransferase/hydolase [Rhodospirillaceae bacterium SYSU D60014]|uniref:C45 family autoproteolytic acyltransferase/hydolase n=1 Tax=Virgifigura deserti TaxID=2268457 RepID=UPI000E6680EC
MELTAISEAVPSVKWQQRFTTLWPRYRAWYLRDALDARPSFAECRGALRTHMPELLPVFEQLSALSGEDEIAWRFLSQYRPPSVITGCSIAVAPTAEPILVRNYDFTPSFFEGTVLLSRWVGHHGRVVATSEALSGVLDGMNEAGLVVALTFGGRQAHGDGFGIPILLRYVLECCATTAEAVSALRRLPCAMVQNVLILDRSGDYVVVYLSPDRETIVRRLPITTNHQCAVEWPEAARFNQTLQRAAALESLLTAPGTSVKAFVEAFHRPPLYRTDYLEGLGTLYTAIYYAAQGTLEYLWPGRPAWAQSFDIFEESARALPV